MCAGRIFNAVYCAFFAMIIILPLLFFNLTGKVSSENRMLTEFPALPENFAGIGPFTRGVESWLDDRIGFRKQFITSYRLLELKVFGVSPSKLVALGKDGTAFLLEAQQSKIRYEELYESAGESGNGSPLDTQQLAGMTYAAELFNRAKTPVIMLAVPTSPLFNYDKLPQYLRLIIKKKTPENHPVALAVAQFEALHPRDAHYFLYPFKETLKLAKCYSPYPQKNFHWSWSPFTVMISEMIAERFKSPVRRQFSPTDFSPCTTRSDLAHLVGINDFMNENDLCPSAEFYVGENIVDSALAEAFPESRGAHVSAGTYYKNTAVASGKILVIGDSFNFNLGIPLARNFREVLVLDYYGVMRETHNNSEPVLRQIKNAYNPEQIVIVRHNIFMDLQAARELCIFFEN